MPKHLKEITLHVGTPGLYLPPAGAVFEGLVPPRGEETIQIRFSLGRDKLLDIPVSAESLEKLMQRTSAFHGRVAIEMAAEVENLRQQGDLLER